MLKELSTFFLQEAHVTGHLACFSSLQSSYKVYRHIIFVQQEKLVDSLIMFLTDTTGLQHKTYNLVCFICKSKIQKIFSSKSTMCAIQQ